MKHTRDNWRNREKPLDGNCGDSGEENLKSEQAKSLWTVLNRAQK